MPLRDSLMVDYRGAGGDLRPLMNSNSEMLQSDVIVVRVVAFAGLTHHAIWPGVRPALR